MSEHKTIELSEANFEETLSKGTALVDFWAAWCAPCLMQGPIVQEVAEAVDGRATIAKMDVDSAQALAQKLGIMSIPTIIIFKDGQEVQRFVGVQSKASLVAALEKAI